MPEGTVTLQVEPDLLAGGWNLPSGEAAGYLVEPGGQRFRDCSETPVVGGDGHRPTVLGDVVLCWQRHHSPPKQAGYSLSVPPWVSLESFEDVEINESHHGASAEGFIGQSKGPVCADIIRRRRKWDLSSLYCA